MTDTSGPADTVMMGVMHDAMPRDFVRACAVLSSETPLGGVQRAALADHVVFMLEFLHDHHHNEDERLWPLVRAHDPMLGEALDRMSDDHASIAAGAADVLRTMGAFRSDAGDAGRRELAGALDGFNCVLLPHLAHEEAEVMPRVSACLTADQWHAFEKDAMPPFTVPVLAEYFNWFLEDLDEDRTRRVKASLPAPIVFTMTRVFGRGYRRRAAQRWLGAAA
jgi:hemerythrin-like domain-containing protein